MTEKKWHTQDLGVLQELGDLEKGLSSSDVLKSREVHGENKLAEEKPRPWFLRLLDQFRDTMIIILMIAAAISFVLSEPIDAIVIMAIVILNAVIGLIQEGKAEEALKALKDMSSPNAKVIRDGEEKSIPSPEVVVGDIVVLEAGDLVPADIRLITTNSLKLQEASLTGESVPVDKFADTISEEDSALGDRKNMAYSSGMVAYGRGTGMVVAVGMETEVGKIAKMLQSAGNESTPLQKQLDHLGKVLGYAALFACALIFAIGIFRQHEILEMFLTAVSLAVAVIPEGLPAIATIVLAMGVQRLVKKHAIIRNLPSVETLGSATVICSDKTGTLTQNKMTVVDSWTQGNPDNLVLGSVLCNDSRFVDNNWVGDPTETAFTAWSDSLGIDTSAVINAHKRVNEVPFDSGRKRMTTVNVFEDGLRVYTKGGVDEVLAVTTRYLDGDTIRPLTEEDRKAIQKANIAMAEKALRVLAVASKKIDENPEEGSLSLESDLVFEGLVGMIDPPRPEVIEAIKVAKNAGIRTVMITGDHALTATAIAKEIGLLEDYQVITGKELDMMSDDELFELVKEIGVYARVSPEDKMRIIDAWKRHGDVVAMTGDGVNDAPALKKADIGAAMGIVGTEVAKSASDMVLTDDNFATVVVAVGEGRRIKDNIKKAINYLLSCNVGELLTLLITTLMNWGTPLLPIHILWVNLVTDSLPALALGVDPEEDDIMEREPDRIQSLINGTGTWRMLYQGVMVGLLTLIAYLLGSGRISALDPATVSESAGQTMAFSVLAFAQLVHAYNIHSPRRSVFVTFFKNKWLVLATVVNALMMFAVLLIPAVREVFSLTTLSAAEWELVALLAIMPLPIVELMKLLKLNGKRA